MVVEFGTGEEPWSIDRVGVKRWMHCRVDVEALPDKQRYELSAWLAGRDLTLPAAVLVVTRGDDGYRVHLPAASFDVSLEDLPVGLQRQEPQGPPKPKRGGKARS